MSRVGKEPFLYLIPKTIHIITTNGIVVHQEIGVRFVLRYQMANPIECIDGLRPNIGRRRGSEGVLPTRSREKGVVAFEMSQ